MGAAGHHVELEQKRVYNRGPTGPGEEGMWCVWRPAIRVPSESSDAESAT